MAPVWDIDPVLFSVPGSELAVRYYGVIFTLVFLGGFILFYRQTLRAGGTADQAYDIILPGFIGLLLGARLGHVLFYNFGRLASEPSWLFKVWEGGLSSHGATVGLSLALIYYARKEKLPILAVTDRFSFSAALGAGLVRLGNFFNSEIVGRVTTGPFGIKFPLYDRLPPSLCPARFPSQLVEMAMGLFILGVLCLADQRLGKEKRPRGVLSAIFLVLYFLGRFFVEFIKERQGPNDNFWLSKGQILSLPILALGMTLFYLCLARPVYELEPIIPAKKNRETSQPPVSSLSQAPPANQIPGHGQIKRPKGRGKRSRH
ncbi:MAG: prolipoprotein diacylglyceryl transferase [Deltaproteobacteria bacterium]|jgi:prolipoprotein diacylglyceryl transferase|nr:prolipoprotein diacylglyceryl transferase [Deltaproteobacteria bacterium]